MISVKKRFGFVSCLACCLVVLTFSREDFSFAKVVYWLPPLLREFVQVLEENNFDTFVGDIPPNQAPERATVAMLGSIEKGASSLLSEIWALFRPEQRPFEKGDAGWVGVIGDHRSNEKVETA
jgi:hypothetical protein